MALLAIKQWLLSLLLAFGGPSCAGGPDELELLYGHTFAGDSRLGEGGGHSWPINNDDSDFVGVGLVWKLKPTEVVVRNVDVPPVQWELRPSEQNPRTVPPETTRQEPATPPAIVPPGGATPTEEALADIAKANQDQAEAAGQIADAATAFNAFDWLTRVLLVLLAGWIAWIYRAQLGNLIPGGKGKGDKDCPPEEKKPEKG